MTNKRCVGISRFYVCTKEMNNLGCPNPDYDPEQTHCHQYNVLLPQEHLLYIRISIEGLSHLYLKYLGLCVTRPSVTRWG
jgi:hypothetical protein